MVFSLDAEKPLTKSNIHFLIKTLRKVGTESDFLNLIKYIYIKPTANNILNAERLNVFLLSSGTRQTCLQSTFLTINIVRGTNQCNRARKRHNKHPVWKGESKTVSSLRTQLPTQKNLMKSTKSFQNKQVSLAKLEDTRSIYKLIVFLCASNEYSEIEIQKTLPFIIALKY